MTRAERIEAPARFARSLGVAALVGFTLSALSPAASVFITGAALLRLAGTGMAVAMVVGGVGAALAACLYAEVAAAAPHAGGVYAGVERLLGRWAAHVVIVLSILMGPAFIAFSALGLGDYVSVLWAAAPRGAVAVLAVAGAGALAMRRLRTNGIVTGLLLAIELLAVVALALASWTHAARPLVPTLLHPLRLEADGTAAPITGWPMMLALLAGTFACSGVLWGTYLGEDVQGSPRRFGRALAGTGTLGALVVAVPLLGVALAISPAELASPAPLAALIARRIGPAAGIALSAGVAIAIFNNLLAMTIALARLLFATARDGVWPSAIGRLVGRTSARTEAPAIATALICLAALPLLLLPERALMVLLSAELFSPVIVAAAVLLGRRRLATDGYRAPSWPLLPIVAIVLTLLFMAADWHDPAAGRPGLIALAVMVGVASLFHLRRRRMGGG